MVGGVNKFSAPLEVESTAEWIQLLRGVDVLIEETVVPELWRYDSARFMVAYGIPLGMIFSNDWPFLAERE